MAVLRNLCCRLGGRFRHSESGSAVVEFAFGAPIVVLLLAGAIELGMIMFVNVLMESALRDASRYGITGQVPTGETRLQRIKDIISKDTIGLVDMNKATIDVKVYPSFADIGKAEAFVDGNGNGVYDTGETFTDTNGNGKWDSDMGVSGAGGPGDIVIYRVSYDWPLLTPLAAPFIGHDGTYTLTASIAVRNEPWKN